MYKDNNTSLKHNTETLLTIQHLRNPINICSRNLRKKLALQQNLLVHVLYLLDVLRGGSRSTEHNERSLFQDVSHHVHAAPVVPLINQQHRLLLRVLADVRGSEQDDLQDDL